MCVGVPPFQGKNRDELFNNIIKMNIEWPEHLSLDCIGLIMGLLNSNVNDRLGCGDKNMEMLKKHPWFKNIDFEKLENKKLEPPYKPTPVDLENKK